MGGKVKQYLDDDGNEIDAPASLSLKELMAEVARRKPVLPPTGYVLDSDNKISEAIRKHQVEAVVAPYVASAVPKPVPQPEPAPDPIPPQDTPIEVVDESEAPSCTACESGDCLIHNVKPDEQQDNPVATKEIQSVDESNSVPQEAADNARADIGDGTGTVSDIITSNPSNSALEVEDNTPSLGI